MNDTLTIMENEIWKDILGYEGLYQVSNYGRIKSLKRYDNRKRNLISEHLLKGTIDNYGYLLVHIVDKNHINKRISVHRLVAKTFIINLENKKMVNHKDSNKLNNKVTNLEWVSHDENCSHFHRFSGYGDKNISPNKQNNDEITKKMLLGITKTKYLGIEYDGTGYKVRFHAKSKNIYLGKYFFLSDAIEIRDKKILELKGDKALTNKKLIEWGILNPIINENYDKFLIKNNKKEMWKLIINSNLYFISNLGRVKKRQLDANSRIKEILIRGFVNRDGYLTINIGSNKQESLHRIIAKHFIPNPNHLFCVNHKDLNKLNNSIDNLEWITNEDNIRHFHEKFKEKGGIYLRGERNPNHKLTTKKVIEIKKMFFKEKKRRSQIAYKFFVEWETINSIVKGKTWAHVAID